MEPVTPIRSRTVALPLDDIDTDQIIPARFLTTTSREGLGQKLFSDWRYDENGTERADFILNSPATRGAQILVTGRNFGCGSSREHAPWALMDYGFRAIVSTEIADIFASNALKNGLLPIIVDEGVHRWLLENPGAELTIDLQSCKLTLPDGAEVAFPIDKFSRHCLLSGLDQLGFLLDHAEAIAAFEARVE